MLKMYYEIDKGWLKELKSESDLQKINHLLHHSMIGELIFESETESTKNAKINPDTFLIWFDFFLDDMEKIDFRKECYLHDIDGLVLDISIKDNFFQIIDRRQGNIIFKTTTSKSEIIKALRKMMHEVVDQITKANRLVLEIPEWKGYSDSY